MSFIITQFRVRASAYPFLSDKPTMLSYTCIKKNVSLHYLPKTLFTRLQRYKELLCVHLRTFKCGRYNVK